MTLLEYLHVTSSLEKTRCDVSTGFPAMAADCMPPALRSGFGPAAGLGSEPNLDVRGPKSAAQRAQQHPETGPRVSPVCPYMGFLPPYLGTYVTKETL